MARKSYYVSKKEKEQTVQDFIIYQNSMYEDYQYEQWASAGQNIIYQNSMYVDYQYDLWVNNQYNLLENKNKELNSKLYSMIHSDEQNLEAIFWPGYNPANLQNKEISFKDKIKEVFNFYQNNKNKLENYNKLENKLEAAENKLEAAENRIKELEGLVYKLIEASNQHYNRLEVIQNNIINQQPVTSNQEPVTITSNQEELVTSNQQPVTSNQEELVTVTSNYNYNNAKIVYKYLLYMFIMLVISAGPAMFKFIFNQAAKLYNSIVNYIHNIENNYKRAKRYKKLTTLRYTISYYKEQYSNLKRAI